jgi:deoxyribonuclease V
LKIGYRKLKIAPLHPWNLDYASARRLQTELAAKVRQEPFPGPINTVAGVDCAFSRDKKRIAAVVVVLRLPDFELIEQAGNASCPSHSPHPRPSLLPQGPGVSGRRAGACCKPPLMSSSSTGLGVSPTPPPGIASHLGLFLGCPTIGCKCYAGLIGDYDEPPYLSGSHSPSAYERNHRRRPANQNRRQNPFHLLATLHLPR